MPKFYRVEVARDVRLYKDLIVAVPDGLKDEDVEAFLEEHLTSGAHDDSVDSFDADITEETSSLDIVSLAGEADEDEFDDVSEADVDLSEEET